MDRIITHIQFESLHLRIYKRCLQGDEQKIALATTLEKKNKYLKDLRKLVKNWPYVPMCAAALLEDFQN
uniref:AsIV-cont00057-ORF1 n=1 Tax=Apophua simplicipes ichnovirus TaxID=1329648 RepID=S5DMK7_9VIRU|nr:AsIV-cont00057-ORF1 [Apophua simplicipes ichnovirus]